MLAQVLGGGNDQAATARRPSAGWREVATDLGAGTLVIVLWAAAFQLGRSNGWHPRDPLAWAIAGVGLGIAVAVRRIAGVWLIAALAFGYVLVYFRPLVSYFHLLPILVLGFAGAQLGVRRLWVVVGACALAVGLLFSPIVTTEIPGPGRLQPAFERPPTNWSDLALAEFATISVVLLGAAIAAQRAAASDLADRNEELERLRRSDAERAVAEERLRISREVHDVVAHHLTAILMRAQAADRVRDSHPEEARDAVAWIAEESRDALRSTRVTVSSLRDADGVVPGGPDDGPLAADIAHIVERIRQVGLPARLSVEGSAEPLLAPQVGLAVRRTVQEALTNTLKHAHATAALVVVRPDGDGLNVDIIDNGTGASSGSGSGPAVPGGGAGLAGMQERAAACGGRLRYGAIADGGWQVRLWVPVLAGPGR